ncbi:MAG: glycerate kinase [Candidatus Brocadiia bacterium]
MKIVIAPDSFKETLSAPEVAEALKKGVIDASPQAEVVMVPLGDGGEGTTDAVVVAAGGSFRSVEVPDPLGHPVRARFGLIENGTTAVLEMAAASGLDLLGPSERNPLQTSTKGTGVLIRAALDAGASRMILGVGGSATVDCGIGMAAELGAEFLDRKGKPIENPAGGDLGKVESVRMEGLDGRLRNTEVSVACDVTNPLVGNEGAARVYGPQKGADTDMVERLEKGIKHFAGIIRKDLGIDVSQEPGGGAAGGLAAGLAAFAGARLERGIETVMDAVGLEAKMEGAALVITGEGKADLQSAFGKTPAGVGELARKSGVPAVLAAGMLEDGYRELYRHGITAAFSIAEGPMKVKKAHENTERLLRQTAEGIVRLISPD